MVIIFTYIKDKRNKYSPFCILEQDHELNPITGYLNDPMGGKEYFLFLQQSLMKLRNKDLSVFDISSNSWRVELEDEFAYMNFLYDEDNAKYHLKISRNILVTLLNEWLEFVNDKADENHKIRIEI